MAEVSSNHGRDLHRSLEFIDVAASCGCAAVKFQLFRLEELYSPEVLAKYPDHRKRKQWELPVDFLPHLSERCRERGVLFSCTPFYLDAVGELFPYVAFYKIASYELLWTELLQNCAKTGKPIVLSTGMATLEEVDRAVVTLSESGCKNLTLLHCVSDYPAKPEEANLQVLDTLRNRYASERIFPGELRVGWSDHTVSPQVLKRATERWGASMIEFHLDLDGTGEEYSSGHCWLPDQIAGVIKGELDHQDLSPATVEPCDGDGAKNPSASEMRERPWRADPVDGLRPLREFRSNLEQIYW